MVNVNNESENLPPAVRKGKELLQAWSAAFAENKPLAMAGLYHADAAMYGSKPELFVGSEGVLRYFSSLAPRRERSVWFDEITACFVTPDVLALAATAGFVVDDLPAILMRFTQTWVRSGDVWQVISHHASPKLTVR